MPAEVASKSEQRVRLALQLLCALFLLWLYVGDLLRFIRAQSAPLAVLHDIPSLPLSLVGSVVAVAFAVTLFLAPKRPVGWRPRRLAVIAAVLLIFVDFLVLATRRSSEIPEVELGSALGRLTDALNDAATLERVPTDAREFEKTLSELGPVPVFVNGERLTKWNLEVRRNCTEPATKPAATPATFIYCVSPDATRGWVTVSATEGGSTFGEPGVMGTKPPWVGEVTLAESRPPEPPEDTVRQPPTQDTEP